MNLMKANQSFWVWFWKAFQVLLRNRPLTTLAVVAFTAIGRVTSFLAMVLPLKVILLAGSSGVPRYFAFFISPEEKWNWIIYLAVGAVLCYVLTRVLDALSDRMATSAGIDILEKANELAVFSNQEAVAREFYSRFCKVVAWLLFSFAVSALLLFVYPEVMAFLFAMFTLQILFSLWVLSGSDDINPGALKSWVQNKYQGYLSTLQSINFLGGFFVILLPYLRGMDGNILISIVAFLAVRQMLSALSDMVIASVRLNKSRQRVNAILFREHRLEDQQKKTHVEINDLFSKEKRSRLVTEAIAEGEVLSPVDACWQDSTIPSVTTFVIKVNQSAPVNELSQWCQMHVYSYKVAYQLENEERLFNYLPRARLWAPELVARFRESHFQCQVVEYGSGQPVGGDWKNIEPSLYEHLWSITPGVELLHAYNASQLLMHQRLNTKFFDRIDIALDTDEDSARKDEFMAALPRLTELVEAVPLYVYNPMANAANVVKKADGKGVLITTWGKWKLEPIGVQLPSLDGDELSWMLLQVRKHRHDIPGWFGVNELYLVNGCRRLESLVQKNQFKKALELMPEIVDKLKGLGGDVSSPTARDLNFR
ncbi:hypothetical protein ACR80S_12295 [Halomonas sp. MA07-2]|uniref:hypothetical protein n=1 Tax=Halomonas sp. MA07-2 TaxID=3440841 RepID=UPI003EEC347A